MRFSNALHCGGQELEVRRGVVGEQLAGPVGLGGEVADQKVFGSSISVGTLRLAADGTWQSSMGYKENLRPTSASG